MQKKIGDLKELMKVMVLLLPLVGPVAYTNLSTAIIIVGIAVAMAFVASPKYAQFVGMAIAVFAFGAVFIVTGKLSCRTYQNLAPSGEL